MSAQVIRTGILLCALLSKVDAATPILNEKFDALIAGVPPGGWEFPAGGTGQSTEMVVTTTGHFSAPNAFGFKSAPTDVEAIYTESPAVLNTEVVYMQRINKGTGGNGTTFAPIFRSDKPGKNHIATKIVFEGPGGTGNSLAFSTYLRVNGAYRWLGQQRVNPGFTFRDGEFVWCRMQLTGNMLRFRVWPASGDEPSTWTFTGSNDAYALPPGYDGFYVGGNAGGVFPKGGAGSIDNVTITDLGAPELTAAPPRELTPEKLSGQAIPVTDAGLYFSPYSTYSDGSGDLQRNNVLAGSKRVIWTTPGAYLRTAFSGTSIALAVDESNITQGAKPKLKYSVDGGAWQVYSLNYPSETLVPVADSLSPAKHVLVLYLMSNDFSKDRWNGNPPRQAVQILGLQLETGARLEPLEGPSAKLPRNLLFLGDSITEGHSTVAAGAADSTLSWTHIVAEAFQAEYGNIGHGGLGWTVGASDGTPPLRMSYSQYSNGHSRLFGGKFVPLPVGVVVNMGTNDGANNTQSEIRAFLSQLRENVGETTPVYMLIPFNQSQSANIRAAIAAVHDSSVFLIDLGPSAAAGLTSFGTRSAASFDGLHPSAETDKKLAEVAVNRMREALSK